MLKGRREVENRGLDRRTMLMNLEEIECDGSDEIKLAKDGVNWRAFLNTI
jgi:hypothetical protein